MSRTGWKRCERAAARLIQGTRHPANQGGRLDCESPKYVVQVKHVARMSLAELSRLATETDGLGQARAKFGLVITKISAGRGRPSPYLVTMTGRVWQTIWRKGCPACADIARDVAGNTEVNDSDDVPNWPLTGHDLREGLEAYGPIDDGQAGGRISGV